MEPGHKYAAIDIGSNAVRLLLSAVFETDKGPYFKKISLIRMPIRLGSDVFINRCISDPKIDQLIEAMTGFKHLVRAYQPVAYRACATSAMREAENGSKVCRRIREKAGIAIQIIDGKEEAKIIFADNTRKRVCNKAVEVYLDVGGGSTEITIFNNARNVSHSFNIGTIRLMQNMVTSADWEEMKQWVREKTEPFKHLVAVCSGGNIHKILKLSNSEDGETISFKHMKKIRTLLNTYSVAERVTKLGLKPDRADVILPAHKIYYSVLKWGRIPVIKVPQMGLADGIIRQLYFQKDPAFSP
jgi:exopolyphosphatase/guanosine-5'-triphosphate,3'-diphosphate pyrophosphatase